MMRSPRPDFVVDLIADKDERFRRRAFVAVLVIAAIFVLTVGALMR
jgi:hypothetical protein